MASSSNAILKTKINWLTADAKFNWCHCCQCDRRVVHVLVDAKHVDLMLFVSSSVTILLSHSSCGVAEWVVVCCCHTDHVSRRREIVNWFNSINRITRMILIAFNTWVGIIPFPNSSMRIFAWLKDHSVVDWAQRIFAVLICACPPCVASLLIAVLHSICYLWQHRRFFLHHAHFVLVVRGGGGIIGIVNVVVNFIASSSFHRGDTAKY